MDSIETPPVVLQVNTADVWTGCDFGCAYCLPAVRRWARKFPMPDGEGLGQTTVQPRTCDPLNIAQLSKLRAAELVRMPVVQLSCLSDPYPRLEETAGRTRRAIALLHRYQVGVVVTTKSGMRAVRDFQPRAVAKPTGPAGTWRPPRGVYQPDLMFTEGNGWDHPPDLGSHPGDAFGASLTFLSEDDSRKWEPRAALPSERMGGLEEAHRRGQKDDHARLVTTRRPAVSACGASPLAPAPGPSLGAGAVSVRKERDGL